MQAEWDDKTVWLGRFHGSFPQQFSGRKFRVECHTLSIATLMNALRSEPGVYIFHMQSSLPFLAVFLLMNLFLRKTVRVVYDMHDLNERPEKGIYRKVRYVVFYLLEGLAAKVGINIMTVSKGLSKVFVRRYKVSPQIVYNIPPNTMPDTIICRDNEDLVYFGQITRVRVPVALVHSIHQLGLRLDIYGRGPSSGTPYGKSLKDYEKVGAIRLLGPYNPAELDFLNNYSYSLLLYDSNKVNIRFCLPNKLLQAMRYGVVSIISSNLKEASLLFKRYPEWVLMIDTVDDLGPIFERGLSRKRADTHKDLNDFLDHLRDSSRLAYWDACGFSSHRHMAETAY